MGDVPEVVTRYWEALSREDFDEAASCLHQEFVEDWPQSGERIVGVENWLETCAVQRVRDGRIARVTEYFAAPFEAADWRADLVQRIGR